MFVSGDYAGHKNRCKDRENPGCKNFLLIKVSVNNSNFRRSGLPGREPGCTPYSGEIRTATDESINYGVTYIIPAIIRCSFYKSRKDALLSAGYNPDAFFLAGD
jgi:hypothetical protein